MNRHPDKKTSPRLFSRHPDENRDLDRLCRGLFRTKLPQRVLPATPSLEKKGMEPRQSLTRYRPKSPTKIFNFCGAQYAGMTVHNPLTTNHKFLLRLFFVYASILFKEQERDLSTCQQHKQSSKKTTNTY